MKISNYDKGYYAGIQDIKQRRIISVVPDNVRCDLAKNDYEANFTRYEWLKAYALGVEKGKELYGKKTRDRDKFFDDRFERYCYDTGKVIQKRTGLRGDESNCNNRAVNQENKMPSRL